MVMQATLPPEAADALRPELPRLADDIIAAISVEVPDYARPMEGRFGDVTRFGVEVALSRFVDLLVGELHDDASTRETYVKLGRGEFRAGRSLDALLAAYRVGARVAWRRFVDAGTRGGLPPQALYDLGEAIFAYIDEISAESVEGFAEAQSAAAGETQRRRRRLLRLLAQDPPAEAEAVRTAAQAAGWPLPRSVAAIVVGEDENEDAVDAVAARLARRLGEGAVGAAVGGLAVVMLPDPAGPGRRRAVETALAGEPAALGPAVGWPDAAVSLRRAAAAYRLPGRQAGASPAGQSVAPSFGESALVVADDHLPALLLAAEPALASDLARTRLAPLDALAAGPRERLETTLRAWLDRPGQVQAVAEQLGVHPQTVRYRLKQLRELFGARLEDPDARFELSLALRAAAGVRYS
jgi:DNA-binding transcriptional ArsR family regulator